MLILAAIALHVLCAGAASEVVHQLAERFTAATGTAVTIVVGTAGQLRTRLEGGERADVVISTGAGIDELARTDAAVAQTRTALGRTGLGVGVRTGTAFPDLSSAESLKRVLLAAHAVASTDPKAGATFGIAFAKVLAQLGIADAMAPKLKLVPGGPSCGIVAKGDADLCVQNVTEIVPVAGITVAGTLPAALQTYVTYTGAVPSNAPAPADGRAFLTYLGRQGDAWRAAGFELTGGQ